MKNIKGYHIMELLFEVPKEKGGAINIITGYVFIDDVYILNIIYNSRGGKADEKLKKAFSDSIEMNN